MPFRDRTGPAGMGPITGRGAGNCTGSSRLAAVNPVRGRRWFNLVSTGRGHRSSGRNEHRSSWFSPRW